MLHILNGESTETVLSLTQISGERFSFRDALIGGPCPAGVGGAEWRSRRAKHLSCAYGVELDKCHRDLLRQEEVFASFPTHDEVVLWFESDLFCQTNMLYVLDWFAQRDLGRTKLSLVCIGEFPGRPGFRGLGELEPEQLASLFEKRNPVSGAEFELATKAWQAYRSSDPRTIERLVQTDNSLLPFLKDAFRLHLERFPSSRNGLGRIENRGLDFVGSGATRFVDLFSRFSEAERDYGLGDAQLWNALQQIIRVSQPLLRIRNGGPDARQFTPDRIYDATFEITEAGIAALSGQVDFVATNGTDAWLGGVHLNGKDKIWRWNDSEKRLVFV